MSFFGTLRKVKKGKKPTEYSPGDLLNPNNSLSLTNSSSTPNIHKKVLKSGGQLLHGADSNNSFSMSTTDEDYDSQSTGGESIETGSIKASFGSSSFDVSSLKSRRFRNGKGKLPLKLDNKDSFNFSTGTLTKFVSLVALGSSSTSNTPKINRKKLPSDLFLDPAQYPSSHLSSTNNNVDDRLPHNKSLKRSRTYSEELQRSTTSSSSTLNRSWSRINELSGEIEVDENQKRKDLMLSGVKRFNRNSEKGMNFLVQNFLLENTPQAIAAFLKTNENLSKTAIGNYLGEKNDFNESVLQSFVQYHDLSEKSLVDALREFLQSFRLPGEAQKIDRMMEAFASHYCEQNPGMFHHQDTCYILSFALIMLNTTLHNPNIKDKPSVEQFISMNRGIDNGQSLDPIYLTSFFHAIKNEEFKIPKEDNVSDIKLTFYNAEKKGWLWKQGARYKSSWKRRWFVLNNNCLYYFSHPEETVPRSIIPLENIEARSGNGNNTSSSSPSNKYFTFYLINSTNEAPTSPSSTSNRPQPRCESIKSCKTLSDGKIVLGCHSEYVLGTNSGSDRDEWLNAINKNSSLSHSYTLLQQKKRNMTALQAKNDKKTFLSPSRKKPTAERKATFRKSQISMPVERPDMMEMVMSPVDELSPSDFLPSHNESTNSSLVLEQQEPNSDSDSYSIATASEETPDDHYESIKSPDDDLSLRNLSINEEKECKGNEYEEENTESRSLNVLPENCKDSNGDPVLKCDDETIKNPPTNEQEKEENDANDNNESEKKCHDNANDTAVLLENVKDGLNENENKCHDNNIKVPLENFNENPTICIWGVETSNPPSILSSASSSSSSSLSEDEKQVQKDEIREGVIERKQSIPIETEV